MKAHPADRKGLCDACGGFALRVEYRGHRVCRDCKRTLEDMLRAQGEDAEIMGNVRTWDERVGDRFPGNWKLLA